MILRPYGTRRQLWFAAALLLLASIALLARLGPLPSMGGVRLSMAVAFMEDFKLAIYCPTYLLLHGGNPYDLGQLATFCPVQEGMPMYLPSTFLIHAPFGLLPIDASTAAYFVFTLCLVVALAAAAFRLTGLQTSWAGVLIVAALVLLSRPGQWTVLLGQPALQLAVASYVALYYARRRPWLSGFGLAVAACKPTFGAPLAVLMAARGDLQAVAKGAILAAVLNVPVLALLADRANGTQALADEVLAGHREWQAHINPIRTGWSVDIGALIGRFIGHLVSPWGQVVLALGVLAPTAMLIRRLGDAADQAKDRLATSLVCVAILLAVHHQAYDLVLLTAPAVVLARRGLPTNIFPRRWELALYAMFVVLGLNYFASNAVLSRLEEHPIFWLMIASSNGVALFGTFLIYLGGLVRIQRHPVCAQHSTEPLPH